MGLFSGGLGRVLPALALVVTACSGGAFEVRDYPLDLAPTDEEFVKYESLGEGTLPSGARALLGTVIAEGPVDAELVRDALVGRGQRIGHCYAGLLARHPGAGGDLVLVARIDGDGVMRDVEPVYNATSDVSLARCVANGVNGMRFPESERRPSTDVRIPLRFYVR